MSKMAIFAEGRTEVEFNSKLIQELAHPRAVTIESRTIKGRANAASSERIAVLQTRNSQPSTHFFLIYNCRGDDGAKARMIEEYQRLATAGYSKIVCHRDVAPRYTYAELSRLEADLPKYVNTKPIPVVFVLSVMMVEAWFLAEYTHFPNIDPSLTVDRIIADLGFDPRDDMQIRPTPTDDLINCYALAQKVYDKWNTQPTIEALDYTHVALGLAGRFPHVATLCNAITSFLDS